MDATFGSATLFSTGHASACKMIQAAESIIAGFAPKATVTGAPCGVYLIASSLFFSQC
jgi:hypothetical protein